MNAESSSESIACPKCKSILQVPVIRVLQPDSPAMAKLLDGTLNCPSCPDCGAIFQVQVEQLIFKDPDQAFLLVQTPPPEENRMENLQQEIDSMASEAAFRENLERPTVRLVFSREDFIEKIFLHLRSLDDRLVEYAKFQLFQNTGGASLMPAHQRLLYDFSRSSADRMQFIVFNRETGKPCAALHLPMEDFQAMADEFSNNDQLQQELERIFPDCYVHVDRLYE